MSGQGAHRRRRRSSSRDGRKASASRSRSRSRSRTRSDGGGGGVGGDGSKVEVASKPVGHRAWTLPKEYVLPDSEDEYVKSFSINESKGIRDFFQLYGFVVVRNVISRGDASDCIDDIWHFLENQLWRSECLRLPQFQPHRDNYRTWTNNIWPEIHEEGILLAPPFWTEPAIRTRQNPNVHAAFATLLGTDQLLCNHDRYGIFRPTVAGGPHQLHRDYPEWKTIRNLHLDMNPWFYCDQKTGDKSKRALDSLRYGHKERGSLGDFIVENNEIGYYGDGAVNLQGLVNLQDNLEDDGGFQLVPGFKNHLLDFVRNTPELRDYYGTKEKFILFPTDAGIHPLSKRITAAAGSLVIWDQMTAHGSAPNHSSNMRYAQFLKYFPAQGIGAKRAAARATVLQEGLQRAGTTEVLTDLGSKLFGLVPWTDKPPVA